MHFRKGFSIAAVIITTMAWTSQSMGAKSITMGSPAALSTWDAGAFCAAQGSIEWLIGTDARPTGATVYVLTGPDELVTNSDFADILNIDTTAGPNHNGSEDWQSRIALTAAIPKIGGINDEAIYAVQAIATFKGFAVTNAGTTVEVQNTILVKNG